MDTQAGQSLSTGADLAKLITAARKVLRVYQQTDAVNEVVMAELEAALREISNRRRSDPRRTGRL